MYTLRTHMIDASNIRALPASRYHIQHYNSLQQTKREHTGIQPLRYVKVMKQILVKNEEGENKKSKNIIQQQKPTTNKKLIQAAKNTWEKGHGTIERIDKKTGDIFHLVRTEAIYQDISQEDNNDVKTTESVYNEHKGYTAHLVQVKIPLKINQKIPSEVLPQETITMNNLAKDQEQIPFPTHESNSKKAKIGLLQKIKQRFVSSSSEFNSFKNDKQIAILRNYIS